MKILFAVLLIMHGLITAAFSGGSFNPGSPVQNPAWLSWWPTHMGQSWLAGGIAEKPPLAVLSGILFLASGAALAAGGLGLLGWIIPQTWWPVLALGGAGAGLFILLMTFHPFYLIGIAVNLAVLLSIAWLHWPSFMTLES